MTDEAYLAEVELETRILETRIQAAVEQARKLEERRLLNGKRSDVTGIRKQLEEQGSSAKSFREGLRGKAPEVSEEVNEKKLAEVRAERNGKVEVEA